VRAGLDDPQATNWKQTEYLIFPGEAPHTEIKMDLKLDASLNEFFHQLLSSTIKNQGVDTSEPTECYLVNLLATFSRTQVDDQPLALKMATAVGASPDERARQLKEVGDTSLYVSGFFSESLQRKLVDVDYYIQMGGAAYGELARYFRGYRHSEVFGEVYDELGTKFPRFVDVLAEVSEQTSVSHASVVQLYERWLRTGSEWMERRLREHGVIPKKSEMQ
jgi:hypothetical protein